MAAAQTIDGIEHDADAIEDALYELFRVSCLDNERRQADGRAYKDGAAYPDGASGIAQLITAPVQKSGMDAVRALVPYLRAALGDDDESITAAFLRIGERLKTEFGATHPTPSLLN